MLAERPRADLLVVGAPERGLIARVLMGEDTGAGLSGAPCAVASASRGYRHPPHLLETLGVGYDGSPESELALALAAARELAAQHEATIWALQVLPPGDCKDDTACTADWPDGRAVARLRGLGDDVEGHAVLTRSVRTAPDEAGLDDGLAAGWGSGAWPRTVRAPVR